ncbi:hypothetical protein ACSFBF_00735 [Variovorax sp. ZT5P49]|uniref:hypothetical protein n=1 Tax=Variovorax sp. ZT5P49 TaxID=3443733 RepID=UPI003F45D26E
MFDHKPHRDHPYTIQLEGTSISIRDLMEVRVMFLRLLEQRIGASSRLVKCYRAWLTQLEFGTGSLSDAQLANARIWREAWEHAIEIATPLLSQPQTTTFRFELY